MSACQSGRIRTLYLAVAILGIGLLIQDRIVSAWQANVSLVSTVSDLVGHVNPLSARDLVIPVERSASSQCEVAFTKIQSGLQQFLPGSIRTLGVSLAVCGQFSTAEQILQTTTPDSLTLMTLAITYAQQGRSMEALAVLRETPNAATMLAINGEAAYWAGRVDEALPLLELSLDIDSSLNPTKAQLYQHLSLLHDRKNHPDEAMQYAQLWTEAAPDDYQASLFLAGLYLRQGQAEDAYLVLKNAEALGASGDARFPGLLGRTFDLRGERTLAIPLYREAIVRNPDDPFWQFYLGQALYFEGDFQAAMPYLEKALNSSYSGLQAGARSLLDEISQKMAH